MIKTKTQKLNKVCAVCGKKVKVICYSDKSCRGGHYFGKVPFHTEKAFREALKAGTREWNFHGLVLHVLKKDPVPYKYEEYWECPKCYWKGKNVNLKRTYARRTSTKN